MLPNIDGLNIGNLPIVNDLLGGKEEVKTDVELGKTLEKIAEKDPTIAKELAFALSDIVQKEAKKDGDGKMPKELEGLLKGALDIAANMIPGGGLVKGILGKIF